MNTRLKFFESYLTVWIFLAMLIGLGLGYFFPGIAAVTQQFSVGTTNIPLAVGLVLMMYPPLAKVDYSLLHLALKDLRTMGISLLLNWMIGPLLMFLLSIVFLRNEPGYMVGVIMIGLARCIAMVMVWNDLAKGNREYAALLVALNSLFQLIAYPFYLWLFVNVLPLKLGLGQFNVQVAMADIFISVLVYLGIPFMLGFLSQFFLVKWKGSNWFHHRFIQKTSPLTLYALLFTIVLMFSLKSDKVLLLPFDVIHIAAPLTFYFLLMFLLSFIVNRKLNIPYDKNVAIAFTATGNNFELAIAVAIAVFGLHSPQAFVGVIGPLVEVPVLILLVKLSSWLRIKLYPQP